MYYVCVENNTITAILDYEPNLPATVSATCITDNEMRSIEAQTHMFDIESKRVVRHDQTVFDVREVEKQNGLKLEQLRSTDWKVLRHTREKALGIATSLTNEEYLALEQERQDIAKSIV
jgi:hypothetical protein